MFVVPLLLPRARARARVCVCVCVSREIVFGETFVVRGFNQVSVSYRGADKSLSRPGRKQATATEDFEFHISYL
jgi:hypothetical protein